MTKKFNLNLFVGKEEHKLPISLKVKTYFEDFVIDNILTPKNIIINSKKNVQLTLFLRKNKLSDGYKDVLSVIKPRNFSQENLTVYHYILPIDSIWCAQDGLMRFFEMTFQAIKMFFLEYYKSIDEQFLNSVWDKIDFKYLLGLPYPAHPVHQKGAFHYP